MKGHMVLTQRSHVRGSFVCRNDLEHTHTHTHSLSSKNDTHNQQSNCSVCIKQMYFHWQELHVNEPLWHCRMTCPFDSARCKKKKGYLFFKQRHMVASETILSPTYKWSPDCVLLITTMITQPGGARRGHIWGVSWEWRRPSSPSDTTEAPLRRSLVRNCRKIDGRQTEAPAMPAYGCSRCLCAEGLRSQLPSVHSGSQQRVCDFCGPSSSLTIGTKALANLFCCVVPHYVWICWQRPAETNSIVRQYQPYCFRDHRTFCTNTLWHGHQGHHETIWYHITPHGHPMQHLPSALLMFVHFSWLILYCNCFFVQYYILFIVEAEHTGRHKFSVYQYAVQCSS